MKKTPRIEAARRRMRDEGIDLLVVPPGDDFSYLLSYSPHADERPCYLFLNSNETVFLVPELNAPEAAALWAAKCG